MLTILLITLKNGDSNHDNAVEMQCAVEESFEAGGTDDLLVSYFM